MDHKAASGKKNGGSKLDEIGPDNLFCDIRPLQGHPETSSDDFRGVSEGSETHIFPETVWPHYGVLTVSEKHLV